MEKHEARSPSAAVEFHSNGPFVTASKYLSYKLIETLKIYDMKMQLHTNFFLLQIWTLTITATLATLASACDPDFGHYHPAVDTFLYQLWLRYPQWMLTGIFILVYIVVYLLIDQSYLKQVLYVSVDHLIRLDRDMIEIFPTLQSPQTPEILHANLVLRYPSCLWVIKDKLGSLGFGLFVSDKSHIARSIGFLLTISPSMALFAITCRCLQNAAITIFLEGIVEKIMDHSSRYDLIYDYEILDSLHTAQSRQNVQSVMVVLCLLSTVRIIYRIIHRVGMYRDDLLMKDLELQEIAYNRGFEDGVQCGAVLWRDRPE